MFDGGFKSTISLPPGRYVFFYRQGGALLPNYCIQTVSLYGMPNLVGSASAITNYNPNNPAYDSENLMTHLDLRTNNIEWLPATNASAINKTYASYNSCFSVDINTFTGPYVFGLNHYYDKIQNSLLLV